MSFSRIIVAAALLGFLPAASAQQEEAHGTNANQEGSTVSQHQNWQVRCREIPENGRSVCTLTQLLKTNDDGRFLLRIDVGQFPDGHGGRAPIIVITAPMGVYLPGGITIQVDDLEPATLPYLRCIVSRGCNTWLPITDKVLQTLRAGNTANVTIRLSDTRDVEIPVSLLGFSAGYRAFLSGGSDSGEN